MDYINIQILEEESFPAVVDEGIEVQHCKSCPVSHQQLPQKWFSEALRFFWSSLLFYTTHCTDGGGGEREVICLLSLTFVLLCQSCTQSY